jgi:hypothetical protein
MNWEQLVYNSQSYIVNVNGDVNLIEKLVLRMELVGF